jgi:hypothetical protein
VRKVFNSLGGLLGIVALLSFVIALALIFRSRGGETVAWQPPTASTPVPSIGNVRMSDTPGGPAVINFPSRASSVYLIFEYAQVQDTPIVVRTYDNVGNVLFEQTESYSGSGVETIGVASRAGVFADGRYITNIYVGPELFVVKTLMWAVGEELPTPTPTARPTTIPAPTVVLPTPAIPATPVAMETYISKTLITAKVGDGPGEIGIMPEMPERPASGPPSFTVDKEGNIYILDGYNTRVAKFDSQGTFLVNIPYEQPLAAGDIAVDNKGLIYLLDRSLYGPDSASITQRVKLYDQEGNLMREYFKPDWMEEITWISLDENGNLLAEGRRKAEPKPAIPLPADIPSHRSIVTLGDSQEMFTREQQLASEKFGYMHKGGVFFSRLIESGPDKGMYLHGQNGELIAKLPLRTSSPLEYISSYEVDRVGNIYVALMTSEGEQKLVQEIQKYDMEGNLIASLFMPKSYYAHPSRSIVVDDQGSIYYMQCYLDRTEVIKWERQQVTL